MFLIDEFDLLSILLRSHVGMAYLLGDSETDRQAIAVAGKTANLYQACLIFHWPGNQLLGDRAT